MTITMSLETLQRECAKVKLTCQYVTPGKEPMELGADVVALGRRDGSCAVVGNSLAGQLLLSLLVAGG